MIVVDATTEAAQRLWRSWRRRLHGAVTRTLSSASRAETWRASLPALHDAEVRAVREQLRKQHHGYGRDVTEERIDDIIADQEAGKHIAAATMRPARACALLVEAGIDRPRAIELVMSLGTAVIEAIAFLEVVTLVELDDTARGAA